MDKALDDLRHSLERRMDGIERSVTELRQDLRRTDGRLWALLFLVVGGILTQLVLKAL